MLAAALECSAGIDVGKKGAAVCVLTSDGKQVPTSVTKLFETTVTDLTALKEWLLVPVYSSRDGKYRLLLEAGGGIDWDSLKHIKNVPGRQNRCEDCRQLAYLLRYGLIWGGLFLPDREVKRWNCGERSRTRLGGVVSRILCKLLFSGFVSFL